MRVLFCSRGCAGLLTTVVIGVLFPFKTLMCFQVRFRTLLYLLQLKCFVLGFFFPPDVKSEGLVKTRQSYEKLINFRYKGRQREISFFGRLILEVTVDLTFIERFYFLGEGSFFLALLL